jgi:D-tyrosyl-tRNA(Tyr) deacylase
MKIVVQRVKEASCTVNNKVISQINHGFVLLVGLTHTDTIKEVEYIAKKIANLRIFEDDEGKLNKSIIDVSGEILNISQFTIYADTKKGNRPSFSEAMKPEFALPLYLKLTEILTETYHIKTLNGSFGAMMDISLINDGPVTIILQSK